MKLAAPGKKGDILLFCYCFLASRPAFMVFPACAGPINGPVVAVSGPASSTG